MDVLSTLRIDLDIVKRLARFAARRSREDRIPQVAGSLTFTTLLSLVPLATVAFALFTAFPIFASFQNSLQGFLADHLMPAQINSQIFMYLNQFASKAKGLTTMGMIVLFVTSVMTMMTVESAFNVIWRVRKARPFAQRVLVYWAILTLGPILIGVSLSISSYLFTRSAALATEQHVSMLFDWLLISASVPLTALAFTMLYVYLPNCRVEWRDAVVGGVAAAVAFELAKRGFGLYVRRIPTYTAVYGAFAAAPMFLLWMYLSWFITLVGAMITSALPEIRTGRFNRPRFPGSDLLDALELLAGLADARDAGQPGSTAEQLAQLLRRELATVTRIVADLEEDELIGRLEKDGEKPHYVLVANPARISVERIYARFVIDRKELAYQLKSSDIDAATLLGALENDKLSISLASLLAARRELVRRAEAGGESPALPHPAA
ncbi:YihY family inner membrane protein [Paraburkholderia silviterrae]|uniref:YihY family inner membrane protein n=1 Tax=Paraburkholderia silviterrae TaxID=2528715 RepID=UPI00196B4C3A|nr:YihY family inner membrane protein [Paraburkholderia silviterrae]